MEIVYFIEQYRNNRTYKNEYFLWVSEYDMRKWFADKNKMGVTVVCYFKVKVKSLESFPRSIEFVRQ